jgi:hypothetical protein
MSSDRLRRLDHLLDRRSVVALPRDQARTARGERVSLRRTVSLGVRSRVNPVVWRFDLRFHPGMFG